jgi:formyltetrahydrofolate-dependent phosphoribosylglycinamide formyltransferase
LVTDAGTSAWNLGVLLSGAGRTLEYLLAAIDGQELAARVPVVISSRAGVRGLEVAAAAGIPTRVIARGDFPSLPAFSAEIYDELARWDVDLGIMAGYLRKMLVLPEWEGRILNIHPCLLPEAGHYAAGKGMYGERVHAAVLAHGDRVSGATVHVVTNDYDEGPPLARVEVPVEEGDTPETLGTRVFTAERRLYPATIRDYIAAHPELKLGPRGSS